MLLNIQGMNPGINRKTRWKMKYLKQELQNRTEMSQMSPSIIAITETHLKPYIKKAQIQIPNYNFIRCDRKIRSHGGVLLYLHQSIPITDSVTFDNDVCEAVICISTPTKSIIACIYRPPDTFTSEFQELLNFLEETINKYPDYEINILGDLNFPNICWEYKSVSEPTLEKRESAELLLSFMNKYFLTQFVKDPTRLYNILDIIISNSNNIIEKVTSENTLLSDHNIIEIPLSPNNSLSNFVCSAPVNKPKGFQALDLERGNYKKN